jgi:glycine/D-amino acid oxidase-like deaminating enzyme/nitrite reductase/ring-hydroxylating ferredoxin subunit
MIKRETDLNGINISSGETVSCWQAGIEPIIYSPLKIDITADVVVIGGGIAGVTAAYLLSKSKDAGKVILIDDGAIGSGETGRTTAHITYALDDRYYTLEETFDTDTLIRAAASHWEALNFIENVVQQEAIDCDFKRVDGYLFLCEKDDPEELAKEFSAAKRAGLIDVELLESSPVTGFAGPCLHFKRQGKFHPLKYLKGLCDVIKNNGGEIYTGTHASEITPDRVVTDSGHKIFAKSIIVATNTPVNDRVAIHTKQAPYRTYVIAVPVPRYSVKDALIWDTGMPYHYIRTAPLSEAEDLLIVGGEDHKTGQEHNEMQRFINLENWTREHFPNAGEIQYRWSGQVMEPVDGLAFIGRNPGDAGNIYIATGDSGNGITHGTIAGFLLTDLILGKENKYTDTYEPSRKTVSAFKKFAEENLNVLKQYTDWIKEGDADSIGAIPNGQGAVIREGIEKIAVYKNESGKVFRFSAECPHLGCVIQWNSVESTFDCPCHGSRYTKFGEVVNGPANTNLKIKAPEDKSS